MFFLNPIFLWAGFAVLVPPIIHLFNFRKYKTVYFSDIRFIENIRQTTRRKSVVLNRSCLHGFCKAILL